MSKTKFMVINGSEEDRLPLVINDLQVNNCERYVYLGAILTQDGSVDSSVKQHLHSKQPHVMKFISFLSKKSRFSILDHEESFGFRAVEFHPVRLRSLDL